MYGADFAVLPVLRFLIENYIFEIKNINFSFLIWKWNKFVSSLQKIHPNQTSGSKDISEVKKS